MRFAWAPRGEAWVLTRMLLRSLWIGTSSGVILFNKWILYDKQFRKSIEDQTSRCSWENLVIDANFLCPTAFRKSHRTSLSLATVAQYFRECRRLMNWCVAIFLTTWHMFFATIATQILANFTSVLDARHNVRLSGHTYTRAILPIGVCFSIGLVLNNRAYLFLSVSFIQMLKVRCYGDMCLTFSDSLLGYHTSCRSHAFMAHGIEGG